MVRFILYITDTKVVDYVQVSIQIQETRAQKKT